MYDVSLDDIRGQCRRMDLVKVRAIYAWLGRGIGYTLSETGKQMNRDHAGMLFHIRKYRDYLDEEQPWFRPELKEEIESVKHRLLARSIRC